MLGVGAAALALGIALATGCGTEHPPVGSTMSGPSGAAGTGGFVDFDAGASKPPGCGMTADGSLCDCVDAPLFGDAPTIYFVLDRSGSMGTPDKWNPVRVTVATIMRGLGPRARFGAAMFPAATSKDQCAPGEEIMSVRDGDAPSSGVDGPTTSFLLAATRVVPGGGTPTAPTLRIVKSHLDPLPGKVFVVLATDGAPNCNPDASCGFDQCQPNVEDMPGCPRGGPVSCCAPPDGHPENCNDASATLAAITALKSGSVPVYVVGLPGADTYAALLDQMATAGGTARSTSPRYYPVDTASQGAILGALKKIAAEITGTCTFDLKEEPKDPSLVNVYMDDVVLAYEPVDGWTISGKTVTLVGSACERVKSGDVLSVRIIVGCPRVEPK
jgi:hypothetical protein